MYRPGLNSKSNVRYDENLELMRELRGLKSTLHEMVDVSRSLRDVVEDLKPKPPKTFASGTFGGPLTQPVVDDSDKASSAQKLAEQVNGASPVQ